jgi:predicted RNase H-like HicB family nuclease
VTRDYHITVFYSQDDGGYIADIPDLDACSAFGTSPQAALEEVLQAKETWLAAACEAGSPFHPRATDLRSTRSSRAPLLES